MYISLILNDSEKHAVNYGKDSLTNHTISAAVALHGLGKDDRVLEDWYRRYSVRLDLAPKEDVSFLDGAQMKSLLGKGQRLKSLSTTIARNWPACLDQMVDTLICGTSCSAFHGIINAGWAITTGDARVIGVGFAYWWSEFSPHLMGVPSVAIPSPSSSVAVGRFRHTQLIDCVRQLHANQSIRELIPFVTSSFDERFNLVEQAKGTFVRDEFSLILLEDDNVDVLESSLLQQLATLFVATGARDFFVLHLMTSCFAVFRIARLLSPVRREKLLKTYWLHVLLAYIVQGMPALVGEGVTDVASSRYDACLEAALSYDEHLFKLGFLAMRERELGGGGGESTVQVAFVTAVHEIVFSKKGFVF